MDKKLDQSPNSYQLKRSGNWGSPDYLQARKNKSQGRPETRDQRLQSVVCSLLTVATIVLSPTVSYAATKTSDTTTSTQGEPSTALSRLLEASKKVANRALSSKAQRASKGATPAATGVSDTTSKAATATASVTAKTTASVAGSQSKVAASQTLSDFGSKKVGPKKKEKVEKTWEDKLPVTDPVEEELEKELAETKENTYEGIVSGAGFNGIAVGGRNGAPGEMWFDYAKGLRLSGVAKPSEFQMGDTVKVFYKETKNRQRFLKGITLVRKAPIVPEAPAEEVQEEEKE